MQTRADLTALPGFSHLSVDTSGNPCVWRNRYRAEDGREWEDEWSCQCDDEDVSPHESEWIGPDDQALIDLWERLPEAGAHELAAPGGLG